MKLTASEVYAAMCNAYPNLRNYPLNVPPDYPEKGRVQIRHILDDEHLKLEKLRDAFSRAEEIFDEWEMQIQKTEDTIEL